MDRHKPSYRLPGTSEPDEETEAPANADANAANAADAPPRSEQRGDAALQR
tara:strand:- start:2094 stop:2246 length:153 start_codon:yes stop_codon:yes gene_type:complete